MIDEEPRNGLPHEMKIHSSAVGNPQQDIQKLIEEVTKKEEKWTKE